jgi:hypothetical protein
MRLHRSWPAFGPSGTSTAAPKYAQRRQSDGLACGQAVSPYSELRAASGRQPTNDLWIAATALAYDFTLITGDEGQATLPLSA